MRLKRAVILTRGLLGDCATQACAVKTNVWDGKKGKHVDKTPLQWAEENNASEEVVSLLREVSTEDLVIALKTASEEMREKVFANVSSRAAEQIKEEGELLPPMKLSEVEAVQVQIVDAARRLEEEGKLNIDAGGGDDVLV